MSEKPYSRIFLILLGAAGLFVIFRISAELFGTSAIEALSGAFSVILSGLLVLLYSQQKSVLERQERIMEAEFLPILSYENCGFVPTSVQMTFGDSPNLPHEASKFDAYNYGQGRALKISTEIVVGAGVHPSMDRERQAKIISKMAEEANPTESASKTDKSLKNPHNSLDSQEDGTFIGTPYVRYLPTEETHSRFHGFRPKGVEPGDFLTATIVVEYQDVLGNTFTDIPFSQTFQYVPDTPLDGFPTSGEGVKNPRYSIHKNVNSERDRVLTRSAMLQ